MDIDNSAAVTVSHIVQYPRGQWTQLLIIRESCVGAAKTANELWVPGAPQKTAQQLNPFFIIIQPQK